MSIGTEKMSTFDTWVVTEAIRVVGEQCFREDSCEEWLRQFRDAYGASTDPPADFDAMLHRFRELTEARKAAEEQAKHWQEEAAKLESLLVESFGASGTQSIKRDGKTFYLQREFQVSAVADRRSELVAALVALGHDEMICAQPQRLASYCREMLNDEAAGGLPVEIRELVKVHEQQRLRMRNS